MLVARALFLRCPKKLWWGQTDSATYYRNPAGDNMECKTFNDHWESFDDFKEQFLSKWEVMLPINSEEWLTEPIHHPKFKNGNQSRITEFVQRRGRLCEDCGLERRSGGNNGEFSGPKYSICSGSRTCRQEKEDYERENSSDDSEEDYSEQSFNEMVT
ncbi:unnamed protein product [Diatraea saccharalis]|uniref:Uncharacterized protein n=1 Tax=Diatraea saccharalis TaxID=40085 RepID=A0A9N9N0Q9_9NEOP|nr:unnamed protein product [Diatraea saccharalis]